jgi:outer membrane lipoprotein LolB
LPVEEAERERLYQAKADRLTPISEWRIEGRLAVSNEKDGGSGAFRWSRSASGSHMDFHGALGRGAWTLEASKQSAEMTLADGTVRRADSVEELVWRVVGWRIPVESLSWWARGLAEPGNFKERVVDGEGNISSLQQNDWAIAYDRYGVFEGASLPTRLTARQGEWKIKLAIRSWELNETGEADD